MENKHSKYDLAQMQSLPLEYKEVMTKQRIKAWYEHFDGQVYVSISGGKDSQVLAHLVKSLYEDVPLIFVNTGLENDSVMKKGSTMADEVLRPEMDFVSVVKKYGYPIISKEVANAIGETRKYVEKNVDRKSGVSVSAQLKQKIINGDININDVPIRLCQLLGYAGVNGEKSIDLPKDKISLYNKTKYAFLMDAPFRINSTCCNVMKKNSVKKYEKRTGRKPFIGTLAEESRLRETKWIKYGCNAFETNNPSSQPLSFWTEQDILKYIKKYNIQIAEIYGLIGYVDEDGMLYDNNVFNEAMELKTTGANRTGCVFCMFGMRLDPERFLRLKKEEPVKYDYVMRGGTYDNEGLWIPDKGLGYKFVIDWINDHSDLNILY